jgi:hypothetical protein
MHCVLLDSFRLMIRFLFTKIVYHVARGDARLSEAQENFPCGLLDLSQLGDPC